MRAATAAGGQRRKAKPVQRQEWDGSTSVVKPLCVYNSLKDQSLASYFGKGHQRKHLVSAGIITDDGRIVQLNRGFSRVVVAEQQFSHAEREENERGVQEYHLRKQLLSRTAMSKEKMEKDNRVNKLRSMEHKLLAKRKQERQRLYERTKLGEEYAEERRQTAKELGKVRPEKRNYRMDWKHVSTVAPEKTLVTTTVRSPSAESSSSTSSRSSYSEYSRRSYDSTPRSPQKDDSEAHPSPEMEERRRTPDPSESPEHGQGAENRGAEGTSEASPGRDESSLQLEEPEV